MKFIDKGAEPKSLTLHRAQAHSSYENYLQKDELREALVKEQKGLCCYCTGRIRADSASMKVEHWKSQSHHPGRQLDYGNLLGACLGGHGEPLANQHCDTRKGDRDLKWNPADPAHAIEARLRYLFDGTIESTDPAFDKEINCVLGLNVPLLRSTRKAVLDVVLTWWRTTPKARQKVGQQINRCTAGQELDPFSPVAVWFLRQKLGGAAA